MPTVTKSRVALSITAKPTVFVRSGVSKATNVAWSFSASVGPSISRKSGTQSSIQYQTGNDGAFRPCTHDTYRYLAMPVSTNVCVWDDSAWVSSDSRYPGVSLSGLQSYFHQLHYGNLSSALASASLPVDSVNWSNLAQTALDSMMPSFKARNSLVNFILELKDFKRLALSLTRNFISKSDVIRAALGFNHWDKPMAKLSRTYLSYQFGWRPLFSDIASMVSTLSAFNERMSLLKKLADTDLQAHFSTTIAGTQTNESTFFDSGIQSAPGNTGSTGFCGRTQVLLSPNPGIKYKATLRYRYPMPPELLTVSGEARAFLDTLGVQFNPAILWNAIPFSFLVDWVVNVSSWLGKLRTDNVRFKTEIRDFCHSASGSREVTSRQQVSAYGHSSSSNVKTFNWSGWQTTDSWSLKKYRRKKGIPNFLISMQTSGLNEREFLLAGALIRANRR